jgi:hypothetical protein
MAAPMRHDEPTQTTGTPLSPPPVSGKIDLAERIESVKAGLLGALAACSMFGALVLVNHWLLIPRVAQLAPLQIATPFTVLTSSTIAALSGFLFGITYRYIIRQDQNPHLNSGAVLAFGLVRGLTQAEGKLDEAIALLPLVILGAESVLLFAGTRLVLDWVLRQGWVKPFGALTGALTIGNSTADRQSTLDSTQ